MEKKIKWNITLYLEQAEKEKILEIAAKEGRKPANCVWWLLRRALDELTY